MIRTVAILLAALWAPCVLSQEVYTWTDEDGVHYTDDPSTIPKEKKAIAKTTKGADIGVLSVAGSGDGKTASVSVSDPHAGTAEEPSDDEQKWKTAFGEARRRIEDIKLGLNNDRAALENTPETLMNGKIRRANPEYDTLKKRISDEEAALEKAQAVLVELDRKATFEGVPREWRK